MGPTMHSPLSSSDDDLKLSQNEDNVYSRESVRQHHRRHRKQHKSHRSRRHRPKSHSSQAEHSSRHRRHRSHHYDDQYDFEPKPQIMSSKPLVQYDDVSENDDIMDDDINQVFNTFDLFFYNYFFNVYLFQFFSN